MELQDAMPRLDAWGVIAALIDEACVGETIGAAEAAACAALVTDPEIRAGLEQVAADEARHAALAWRALVWLLAAHPGCVAPAGDRLGRALAAHGDRLTGGDADDALAAWGMPSQASRRSVHRGALEVVRTVGARVLAVGFAASAKPGLTLAAL